MSMNKLHENKYKSMKRTKITETHLSNLEIAIDVVGQVGEMKAEGKLLTKPSWYDRNRKLIS